MKLSWWQKQLIRQAAGTKRGELVIVILSGPLGEMIDLLVGGKLSAALAKSSEAVSHFLEVVRNLAGEIESKERESNG